MMAINHDIATKIRHIGMEAIGTALLVISNNQYSELLVGEGEGTLAISRTGCHLWYLHITFKLSSGLIVSGGCHIRAGKITTPEKATLCFPGHERFELPEWLPTHDAVKINEFKFRPVRNGFVCERTMSKTAGL